LIFADQLKRVARLFSGGLCASYIASNALRGSKSELFSGLLVVRMKIELSQSGLQQSNGLIVVSFKSQLKDLDSERFPIRSLPVYS